MIDWAARLVFSPVVWLGIILAGVAALLWVTSGLMRARGIGVRGQGREVAGGRAQEVPAGRSGKPSGKQSGKQPGKRPARSDDDIEGMDDVEAILKKYGI